MHEIPDTIISSRLNKSSHEWIICSLIFLAVFIIYLSSAPRTVVLEDDGMFIMAAYFNGIAHSPGYPLFTLLGHLATQIPIGSVAFRVHALSGFFGAVSCIVLYYIAMVLFNNRTLAIATALCLGVSKTYWSQAIIADVYTLNILIYLVLLLGAIHYVRNREITSRKFLYLMFFIYGLGLSNHWPLLVLSTPSLLAVLWPRIREVFRNIPIAILFLILGLSPYVWMVILSQMDPMISFFGPLNSWHDIWFMISRQGYAGVDQSVAADNIDKLQFCLYAMKESASQFGPFGGVLAIVGFIRQWKYWQKNISFGLVLAYLGSTLLLAVLLGFSFKPLYRDIFKVYPLVSYCVLAIWSVLGTYEIALLIKGRYMIHATRQLVILTFIIAFLCTGFVSNLPYNYRVNDKLGEDYALTTLGILEKDAIFFTAGDLDTGTLGYYNLVEKVRPDVTLYSVRGLVFKNRLVEPIKFDKDSTHKVLSDFIESQQRPIYFIDSIPELYGVRDFGFFRSVDKSLEKGHNIVVENSRIMAFSETLLSLEQLYDTWEIMFHKLLISDYCRIATHMHFFEDPKSHRQELSRICRGYYGLITAASVLLTAAEPDLKFISSLLEKAELARNEAVDIQDYARFSHIKAIMLEKTGDADAALKYYKQSTNEWPDVRNPAYKRLLELHKMEG